MKIIESVWVLLFVLCCAGAAGFFSCVSMGAIDGSFTENTLSRQEPETVRPGGIDENLDSPALKGLPAEAEDYLKTLAEAFAQKDSDFLISQGETRYEAESRSRYDDETYLAMLYRIGPYTEESPFREISYPRLEYTEIRGIRYIAWKEEGPLIKVDAHLIPQRGETIPCEIMLLWRLKEPKVLGIYP
jgi:hypothetical protein